MGFNIVNEQTGEGASNSNRRFFEEWSKIDEQSMPPNMMRTLDELCKMRLASSMPHDPVFALDAFFKALEEDKPIFIHLMLNMYARLEFETCFALILDLTRALVGDKKAIVKLCDFFNNSPQETFDRYPKLRMFIGGDTFKVSDKAKEVFNVIHLQLLEATLNSK